MIEKLQTIREALEYQKRTAINGMASHRDIIAGSCVERLALLDEITATLDSEELVEEVAILMQKDFPVVNTGIQKDGKWGVRPLEIALFRRLAQAAINSIKG